MLFTLSAVSIDITYGIAGDFPLGALRESVCRVGQAHHHRGADGFIFRKAKFHQIVADSGIFVQPMELVDIAAAEVKLVGHKHHVFYGTSAVRHGVAVADFVGRHDKNGGIVMKGEISFFAPP